MPERIYIIWDFQTEGMLRDNLIFAKEGSNESRSIDFPDPEAGMSQGQIWLSIVKPQLDQATRIIGFMDLPNANVGFELGYAVGMGKKVALAVHRDRIPKWLEDPPFAGFSCRAMPELSHIIAQADAEDDWFHTDQPFAPGRDAVDQVIVRLANAVGQIKGPEMPGEPGFFELEIKKLNMLAWRLEDGFIGLQDAKAL